jgi:hypothetical protein
MPTIAPSRAGVYTATRVDDGGHDDRPSGLPPLTTRISR